MPARTGADPASAARLVRPEAAAVQQADADARVAGLRLSLSVLALLAALALFFSCLIPTAPDGRTRSGRPGGPGPRTG